MLFCKVQAIQQQAGKNSDKISVSLSAEYTAFMSSECSIGNTILKKFIYSSEYKSFFKPQGLFIPDQKQCENDNAILLLNSNPVILLKDE